jgi:hypothetical protein
MGGLRPAPVAPIAPPLRRAQSAQPDPPSGAQTRKAQPRPPQANKQSVAPEKTPLEFSREMDGFLSFMIRDLSRGKSVRQSARDFISLMRDFPEHVPFMRAMFAQSSEALLQIIARQNPAVAQLDRLKSVAWLDRLKAEITVRLERQAAEPSPVGQNGNGAFPTPAMS